MSHYVEGCADHKIALINGRCPQCRDKNGEPFILDMQSKILLETCGLYCMVCGEELHVPANLCDEELENAAGGFMADHIEQHGGDPQKVFFSFHFRDKVAMQ